jgi:hypothetical protein
MTASPTAAMRQHSRVVNAAAYVMLVGAGGGAVLEAVEGRWLHMVFPGLMAVFALLLLRYGVKPARPIGILMLVVALLSLVVVVAIRAFAIPR